MKELLDAEIPAYCDFHDGRACPLAHHHFALWEVKLLGEGWHFGVNLEPPADEIVAAYLEKRGLTLVTFEPFGGTDKKGRRDGAYVLAVNG